MVIALMVLEIQSNKAHRLRTTDYMHGKNNNPIFSSKLVVKIINGQSFFKRDYCYNLKIIQS
jgi:hypothetical protein